MPDPPSCDSPSMIEATPETGVLRQFVERARALYSLPAVALRVLELTSSPQIDVPALQACLEHDPALTAKILRVANSSLFSPTRKICNLPQALALLGARQIKLLVLGFSLPKALWSGIETQPLAAYWRRSLLKAVAARELMERFWRSAGDEAFIAGLLQDVGMLVLIQDLGESYLEFLARVQTERQDLAALETATLGFDHTVLSARLLSHWGLPESLARTVGLAPCHERLMALPPPERPVPQALHVASLLAAILVDERSDLLPEMLATAKLYKDLSNEQLSNVIESLEKKVAELAGVLSVELPPSTNFAEIVARAHAQLADAATEMLCAPREGNAEVAIWRETLALGATLASAMRSEGNPAPVQNRTRVGGAKTESIADDPGLPNRVAASIAASRSARRSCSLLLVELDHFADLVLAFGPQGAERLAQRLESAVAAACDPAEPRIDLGDGRIAILLEGYDRQNAAELAREIKRRWAMLATRAESAPMGASPPRGGSETGLCQQAATLSVGLATLALPPKNFPPRDLIEAAERCLSAAGRSGGDTLKSIEL